MLVAPIYIKVVSKTCVVLTKEKKENTRDVTGLVLVI